MTHWRPKGWEVPKENLDQIESFEAGADAILETLRANQWCPYDLSVLKANFRGKVVIIPDDGEVQS